MKAAVYFCNAMRIGSYLGARRPVYSGLIMRRALAFFLVLFLALQSASAGVNSYEVRVSGGSAGVLPVSAQGLLDTKDQAELNFKYRAGRSWEIGKYPKGSLDVPYVKISRFVYGETKNLRVGETIALSAVAGVAGLLLLLSKSHTHYLTIYYTDDAGHDQLMCFEVGKDAIRPLIESLELRTGKKLELETGPVAPAAHKP